MLVTYYVYYKKCEVLMKIYLKWYFSEYHNIIFNKLLHIKHDSCLHTYTYLTYCMCPVHITAFTHDA